MRALTSMSSRSLICKPDFRVNIADVLQSTWYTVIGVTSPVETWWQGYIRTFNQQLFTKSEIYYNILPWYFPHFLMASPITCPLIHSATATAVSSLSLAHTKHLLFLLPRRICSQISTWVIHISKSNITSLEGPYLTILSKWPVCSTLTFSISLQFYFSLWYLMPPNICLFYCLSIPTGL